MTEDLEKKMIVETRYELRAENGDILKKVDLNYWLNLPYREQVKYTRVREAPAWHEDH